MSQLDTLPFPVEAIIADLDGTVINSLEIHDEIWNTFCETYNIPSNGSLAGEPPQIHLRRWIDSLDRDKRPEAQQTADQLLENYFAQSPSVYRKRVHEIKMLPDAEALLLSAFRQELPLALVTNSVREFLMILESHLHFLSIFHSFVAGDDPGIIPKPDPSSILKAMEEIGVGSPRNVVLIGDTPADVEAGLRAQVGHIFAVRRNGFDPLTGIDVEASNRVTLVSSLRQVLSPSASESLSTA